MASNKVLVLIPPATPGEDVEAALRAVHILQIPGNILYNECQAISVHNSEKKHIVSHFFAVRCTKKLGHKSAQICRYGIFNVEKTS